MHEVALCEAVRRIVETHAARQGVSRVTRVYLEIGALAAVEPQAMHFAFAAVMKGGVAEGAVLEIAEVPGRAWCDACRREVAVAERFAACPDCGAFPLRLTAGDELKVRQLEVI